MPIYKETGSKDGKQKYRVKLNYTDAMGKHQQLVRVAYGREEAKDLERRLAYELKNADPAKRMTVQQLYDEYVASTKSQLRETSHEKNVATISQHVLPSVGKLRLDKLTSHALAAWKREIDNKEVRGGGLLTLRSKQNIYSVFATMLNYAVKLDYLPTNPLKKLGNFTGTAEITEDMNYYTAEEFQRFAAAAKERAELGDDIDWEYYVFFSVAFFTGLRKGEIHALKWSDVDGNVLSVKRSIAQKLKGADRETAPKNKSSVRSLQLPRPLVEILEAHKARHTESGVSVENMRVCGSSRSLRDTSIQNRNKQYAEAARLKVIRIHDFRHSHVSLLANEGINIQEIARRLGHARIEMTWNTYSHLYPREEERAIEILDKIKV